MVHQRTCLPTQNKMALSLSCSHRHTHAHSCKLSCSLSLVHKHEHPPTHALSYEKNQQGASAYLPNDQPLLLTTHIKATTRRLMFSQSVSRRHPLPPGGRGTWQLEIERERCEALECRRRRRRRRHERRWVVVVVVDVVDDRRPLASPSKLVMNFEPFSGSSGATTRRANLLLGHVSPRPTTHPLSSISISLSFSFWFSNAEWSCCDLSPSQSRRRTRAFLWWWFYSSASVAAAYQKKGRQTRGLVVTEAALIESIIF